MNKKFKLMMIGLACFMFAGLMNGQTILANVYPDSSQCTWYAWEKAYQYTGIQLPNWGNASGWYERARQAGYQVVPWSTGTVAPGHSIAVWSGGYKGYGHVAYIDSADSVGLNIKEGNYDGHARESWVRYSDLLGRYSMDNAGNRYPQYLTGFIVLKKNDTTAPTISNVKITGVNRDGYTVTCQVSDASGIAKVEFPSWNTNIHSGNDANWLLGSVNGNTATCRVNLSSLKSGAIAGNYMTHIYATDNAGNRSCVGTGGCFIERTAPVITNVEILEKDHQGYTIRCKATDGSGIDRVQFPTWTVNGDQDDIQKDWWSNNAAKGTKTGNTFTYRVNISDHKGEYGMYKTHIYAYDPYGNSVCYPVNFIMVSYGLNPERLVKYDNKLIVLYNECYNWDTLRKLETKMKSNLLEIPDSDKQKAVNALVQDVARPYYYMGGYRNSKTDSWRWNSGGICNYLNFNASQPDCAGDNEFKLSICGNSLEGKWNDLPNDYNQGGFIMETDLAMTPQNTVTTETKKYEYYSASLPVTVAKIFASEKGGKLAEIESKEENDLIASGMDKLTNFEMYLGGTDNDKEGTFTWFSGNLLNYTNWRENEPNNYGPNGEENYIAMSQDGKWNDEGTYHDDVGFIVEYDIVNTVEDGKGEASAGNSTKDTLPENKPVMVDPDDYDDYDTDSEDEEDVITLEKGVVSSMKNVKTKKVKLVAATDGEADGYQFLISTSKGFNKNRKCSNVSKNKVTFKGLKKRLHYVKVRSFAYVDGTKIYGEWSSVKKIRVRK